MKKKILNNKNTIFFLLLMLFVFCTFAILIPYNNAPDEAARYLIPEYIYNYGALPLGTDAEVRISLWGISYAFSPIFAYMVGGLYMLLVGVFTQDSNALLFAARFASITFSLVTVVYVVLISKIVFKKRGMWIFISLVTLFPCFIFVSSYVNNDSLAIMSTAIITYAWLIGLQTDWNKKSCVNLVLGLSLCVLSYQNAYGFILTSIFLFCYELYRKRKSNELHVFLKKGLLIAISVTILGGWFYARNYIHYGDLFGSEASQKMAEEYAIDELKPSNKTSLYEDGVSLSTMLFEKGWMEGTYHSFIGIFGYLNLPLPSFYYDIFSAVFITGMIGIMFCFKKIKELESSQKFLIVLTTLNLIIPIIMNIYYSYMKDYQPQGRYSLPCLIPLMLFVTIGLNRVLEMLKVKSKIFECIFISIMILMMIGILTDVLANSYLLN